MERRQARLGGGVVGEGGGAELTDDGGDVDDGAAGGRAGEGGEECLEGVEGAEEVGGDGGVDLGEGEVEEGLPLDYGGVVDEDGWGAELSFRQLESPERFP